VPVPCMALNGSSLMPVTISMATVSVSSRTKSCNTCRSNVDRDALDAGAHRHHAEIGGLGNQGGMSVL